MLVRGHTYSHVTVVSCLGVRGPSLPRRRCGTGGARSTVPRVWLVLRYSLPNTGWKTMPAFFLENLNYQINMHHMAALLVLLVFLPRKVLERGWPRTEKAVPEEILGVQANVLAPSAEAPK